MKNISQAILEASMSYATYRHLVNRMFAEGKATSGENSEAMLHYTELNIARMDRLDRKTKLQESILEFLKTVNKAQIWIVLTEGWCADAAQILPVMNKMTEANELIELRVLLRDQHLDVMDAFLTNGARSIPKLIVIDATSRDVLMNWGPRPSEAQQLIMDSKEQVKALTDPEEKKVYLQQVKTNLQKWYNKDKTIHTQEEIVEALEFIEQ